MRIVLLGAPGAGKGTQCKRIVDAHGLAHMSSGDILRRERTAGSELGKKAQGYMDSGALVPDDLIVEMMVKAIKETSDAGFILDGFPRNLGQAEALDKALAQRDKAIDKVVYIEVSEDELSKRLSERRICHNCQAVYHAMDSLPQVKGKCDQCGGELYQRPDDTAETVKKRLKIYFSKTVPLIEYYNQAGKLLEVDGEGRVDEVSERIVIALRKGAFAAR